MMITKNDMMEVMLESCPSFTPQWQAFQAEWHEAKNDMPLYIVLADFARHLVGIVERGETTDLPAIFAAVERLHVEGEHYVREAATVGLLEDLQNYSLHPNGTEPAQFRAYLGPVSARWWDKLERFWERGELLVDDHPNA
jgi:hypothetical protein